MQLSKTSRGFMILEHPSDNEDAGLQVLAQVDLEWDSAVGDVEAWHTRPAFCEHQGVRNHGFGARMNHQEIVDS